MVLNFPLSGDTNKFSLAIWEWAIPALRRIVVWIFPYELQKQNKFPTSGLAGVHMRRSREWRNLFLPQLLSHEWRNLTDHTSPHSGITFPCWKWKFSHFTTSCGMTHMNSYHNSRGLSTVVVWHSIKSYHNTSTVVVWIHIVCHSTAEIVVLNFPSSGDTNKFSLAIWEWLYVTNFRYACWIAKAQKEPFLFKFFVMFQV